MGVISAAPCRNEGPCIPNLRIQKKQVLPISICTVDNRVENAMAMSTFVPLAGFQPQSPHDHPSNEHHCLVPPTSFFDPKILHSFSLNLTFLGIPYMNFHNVGGVHNLNICEDTITLPAASHGFPHS
jgi:hypothetical protein